jgi:hypothetical protein
MKLLVKIKSYLFGEVVERVEKFMNIFTLCYAFHYGTTKYKSFCNM